VSEATQTLTVSEYLAARRAWLEAEQLRIAGALQEIKSAQVLLSRPNPEAVKEG
jgi:hypothetical protein